jgi:hypothetical protein
VRALIVISAGAVACGLSARGGPMAAAHSGNAPRHRWASTLRADPGDDGVEFAGLDEATAGGRRGQRLQGQHDGLVADLGRDRAPAAQRPERRAVVAEADRDEHRAGGDAASSWSSRSARFQAIRPMPKRSVGSRAWAAEAVIQSGSAVAPTPIIPRPRRGTPPLPARPRPPRPSARRRSGLTVAVARLRLRVGNAGGVGAGADREVGQGLGDVALADAIRYLRFQLAGAEFSQVISLLRLM